MRDIWHDSPGMSLTTKDGWLLWAYPNEWELANGWTGETLEKGPAESLADAKAKALGAYDDYWSKPVRASEIDLVREGMKVLQAEIKELRGMVEERGGK